MVIVLFKHRLRADIDLAGSVIREYGFPEG
jgi:hypothetical protein